MKRTSWKPALLAVMGLVVVTASGLLLHGNAGSGQSPQVSKPDQQPARGAETPRAADAARTTAPPKTGEAPANGDERRQLLETVGVLTAAHCYQTYVNIGLIADGKDKGTYTGKDAQKLLDSVVSLLDSVDRKLSVLSKVSLDDEDRASLERMRSLADLLREQGKDLTALWESGKTEDEARYENTRKDAWAAISKLMGIGR